MASELQPCPFHVKRGLQTGPAEGGPRRQWLRATRCRRSTKRHPVHRRCGASPIPQSRSGTRRPHLPWAPTPRPLTPDVVRASGESMTASFSAPRRAPRTLRSTGHLPSPARSRSVSRETAPVLRCIHPVHHLGHARGRVPQAQLGSIRDEGAHPRPMLGAELTEFPARERAPDDVASPTHGRHQHRV